MESLSHLFILSLVPCVAFSSYISDEVLETRRSTGRFLLQHKSSCRVDVKDMNYTVITSRCKGPNYTSEICCPPLKELVCPIHDQFNDLTNNCADSFFSYLNLYGSYPSGLFAALCKEEEKGLDCQDYSQLSPHQNQAPPDATAAAAACNSKLLITILFRLSTLLIFYA